MNWHDWPLNRVMDLAVGLLFFVVFLQVTLFHSRQNFRHWSMWVPVVETPLLGLGMLVYTWYAPAWLLTLLTVLLSIGAVSGVYGSYAHVHGVGERVGGYQWRNFMVGPPLTLPALISALSIIGLFALHWG